MNSTGTGSRQESPAALLAEGFASHAVQWATRLQTCSAEQLELLRHAAHALSLATSEGHVCLALEELAQRTNLTELRSALLASGLVGTPEDAGAKPMVVDAQNRLYLHRYFDYEKRLAQRLMRAARATPACIDSATRERLQAFFPADTAPPADQPKSQPAGQVDWLAEADVSPKCSPERNVDWQQLATAMALRQRLSIISGGPGTGKTTTLVNLLACLIAQDPDCRIALAAPTGKAAARMTETVVARSAHLPQDIRARLPADSFTIHRLLGVTPNGFTHHADNRLAIDALVVDEASMLDLALATRLLEAVPETARIILLGDKDQLSAVEAGAVFSDLSADPGLSENCKQELAALCGLSSEEIIPPPAIRASALQDSVSWFNRNFRFAADSGIGRLAADIKGGRSGQALAWLRSGADQSVRWFAEGTALPCPATLALLLAGYADYFEALRRDSSDAAAITAAFGKFRVLCALHEGPRGVTAINERVTQHARKLLAATQPGSNDPRQPWYAGRPVMVLRNDPLLKLFNGDIGITLPDASGELMVYFADAGGGLRAVAPVRLPLHQTAFAMTVHKSQGSEFDAVLVLLPEQRSPVLTRELLYTAVTRARHRVAISASAEVIAQAIDSPTQRSSGLLARLREAAAQAE